jgi:hypothetical protein
MTKVDIIEGPVTGSHWVSPNGTQVVWVFGDEHSITYTCPLKKVVIRRLEHLVAELSPVVHNLDVFIELNRSDKEGHNETRRSTLSGFTA